VKHFAAGARLLKTLQRFDFRGGSLRHARMAAKLNASSTKPSTPMKITTTLLTVASSLILAFGAVAADNDETPLYKEMNAANKDLRKLKKQVADATKKDDNIKLVEDIRKHFDTAKDMEPAATKDQPADKKAAYLAKYKEEIDSVSKDWAALEDAIKADKTDDAKTLLEKLAKDKEQGHKDFNPDSDK
jgi:Cytochrome b562